MDHHMDYMNNQSTVTYFILQGFTNSYHVQRCLFALFIVDYLLIIAGNIVIFVVIRLEVKLHTPMYFLLSNLSFLEIWYTTSTMPKMMAGFLQDVNRISFVGCFMQFYFFFSLGTTECFLLTIMGYDRFLAICFPLRYHKLMSSQVCQSLALACWVTGFIWFLVPIIMISQLPFCGPNIINHFLCDQGPLMVLSCQRDYNTERFIVACDAVMSLFNFLFVLVSYICIITTILKMPSAGRQKAFSTCASHLTVVSIFFGSVMFMYVRPSSKNSSSLDKIMALVYTVITPLLNPLIYALRSKEVKQALSKMFQKK